MKSNVINLHHSNDISNILFLSRTDVERLLTMTDTVKAVGEAFRLVAEGKTVMPPKIYLDLPNYHGDFRAMPAYIQGTAGIKWVSVYPDNRQQHLPSVMATILLSDPHTGALLAVMDGAYITEMRTGAAGGIAVKYLARKDAKSIGLIGAGVQARTQLYAIHEVRPDITDVTVYDINAEARDQFAQNMSVELDLSLISVSTVAEAADSDIVVTTTPAREPVVKLSHIKPGTHINAIGADAQGKQELETDLLIRNKIVVDDIVQASHSGEINVAISQGALKQDQIYGTIGEIVIGLKKGRESEKEITVFDSTGLAVLDIICARMVYEKARR